jgi:pimeloyl-ACP methyl ester carboxylesterase
MKYELPEFYSPQIIELDGVKINYVRKGSGPALLLLHGFPGFWWDWRYLIEPLSNYFDVIVPDLHGSGDSKRQIYPGSKTMKLGSLQKIRPACWTL